MVTNGKGQDLSITLSEEYNAYLKALCRLASQWVCKIRKQFADKAYEMYQNETVRKIVLEYGKEVEELEKTRLRDFSFVAEHPDFGEAHLKDDCLNNASAYAKTVWMLFGIEN